MPSTNLNRELSLPKRIAMGYVMPWLPFATSPVDGKPLLAKSLLSLKYLTLGGRAIHRAMFDPLPERKDGVRYLNPKGELVQPHSATKDKSLQDRYCSSELSNERCTLNLTVCTASNIDLWTQSSCL